MLFNREHVTYMYVKIVSDYLFLFSTKVLFFYAYRYGETYIYIKGHIFLPLLILVNFN